MRAESLNSVLRSWLPFLATALLAQSAVAGPYSRLQVLLPGETAAPGTPSGKTGAPAEQVVGIPFSITIRACDSTWNTVTTVGNSIAPRPRSSNCPPSPRRSGNVPRSTWMEGS